jgi:hypothetical protein
MINYFGLAGRTLLDKNDLFASNPFARQHLVFRHGYGDAPAKKNDDS